jgi:hypothetical protein
MHAAYRAGLPLTGGLVSIDGNPQRSEKVDVLGTKRLATSRGSRFWRLQNRGWRVLHFIKTDGRLQHQEHIKSLFANVLHYIGDLL